MPLPFTVLALVSDEALRRQVKETLASCAAALRISESATLAWTQLERQRPSLLVLDWPAHADRADLCRRIRSRPEIDTMLILAIVRETEAVDVAAVLDAGADDFLLAPFPARAL